jgi:ATP-dependent Lhr-like helicase
VRAAGLLSLWSTGYVEPVRGRAKPYHLLAQQLLAYVLQEGSISRSRWSEVVGRLPVFAGVVESGLGDRIVEHLVTTGMLFDYGSGMLSMGPQGERSYGYRHFLDLTSAFTTNPLFVVRHGSKEIGYLDPISLLTPDRHFARIVLAGRSWQVTSIDWDRHVAWVEPAEVTGRSKWLGDSQPLSAQLCDAIRKVLAGGDPPGVSLTARAEAGLEQVRSKFGWVRPGHTAMVSTDDGLAWWTFAGVHANAGIMAGMGSLLGGIKPDNLAIRLDPDTATHDGLRAFVDALDPENLPVSWIATDLATKLKFADCLPEEAALEVAAARINDPEGVSRALREPIDTVHDNT